MYSILRIQKLKSRQQIAAAVGHNLRLHNVPNADESKTELNKNFITFDYPDLISRLEKVFYEKNIKPRADAVLATEVILTASPEFFKNEETIKNWLEANKKFAAREFGKENLLQFNLHLDELTPHIHLIFTPITKDNRLSMKDLYGGKAKLSALQTRYNQSMRAAGFDLKRGQENSQAKHNTIKKFYSLANKIQKLTQEQLQELSKLLDKFDLQNNIDNELDNLQLLKTINKVKPYLKNH